MNKRLAAVGAVLSCIWLGVTFISLGIPVSVCNALNRGTFGLFEGVIGNARNGFYYEVANKDMPTVVFLFLFSIAFFLYFAASLTIAKRAPRKGTLLVIIFFSILFRLILLPSIPVHENDFYRYFWDGKVLNSGMNPYKYAPGDIESFEKGYDYDVYDWDRKELIKARRFSEEEKSELSRLSNLRRSDLTRFNRIGHRWVPTIYPPFAQSLFAVSSFIKRDSIFVLKIIFILFDILALGLIVKLLVFFKKNPSMVIIYGWSPLVLKEIANSAHYDSAAIFLMLLSIYLIFKNRRFLGSISLALAAAAKFFPILLLPLYIKRIKLRPLGVFAVSLGLLYIPFFIWGRTGILNVFEGLRIYSEKWAYNGGLFLVVRSFFSALNLHQPFLPKLAVGLILIGILCYFLKRKVNTELNLMHRSFVVLAALFLLSPVGDPWYFCWVIPFLCFFPYRSFILLSWLLIFSYLSFSRTFAPITIGVLEVPFLNAVQYIPFFVLLAVEITRSRIQHISCKKLVVDGLSLRGLRYRSQ